MLLRNALPCTTAGVVAQVAPFCARSIRAAAQSLAEATDNLGDRRRPLPSVRNLALRWDLIAGNTVRTAPPVAGDCWREDLVLSMGSGWHLYRPARTDLRMSAQAIGKVWSRPEADLAEFRAKSVRHKGIDDKNRNMIFGSDQHGAKCN